MDLPPPGERNVLRDLLRSVNLDEVAQIVLHCFENKGEVDILLKSLEWSDLVCRNQRISSTARCR